MNSTVALLQTISVILNTTVTSMRVMNDILLQIRRMQEEDRDPTAAEWDALEAKADAADARLANAIREARL